MSVFFFILDFIQIFGAVAESGDDFTKFPTIFQWFQTLIHPALIQRPFW
ncbi:hypothetical protein RintRC_7165 [Richelia intracellularis]|nr:hypothetical protein RintRC_7165 [Richelia intracellularis]